MLNNSTKYLKLVNFSSNLDEPKHNWFNKDTPKNW